jgi:hypothetical protein
MPQVYKGRSVAPRQEPIVYRCACGERFSAQVWRAIDASDATLRTRLIEGDLNRVRCPRCDAAADVQVSVLFHEPGVRLIHVAPTSERHRELQLRAELFTVLAGDVSPPTEYVLASELVFGSAGLSELLAAARSVTTATEMVTAQQPSLPPSPPPPPAPEPALTVVAPPPAPTPAPPAATVAATDEPPPRKRKDSGAIATAPDIESVLQHARAQRDAEARALEPAAPARSPSSPTVEIAVPEARPSRLEHEAPARSTVSVPDPRTAVIERWIAARESDTAMFVDDRVVVCASLPAVTLEHFVARDKARVRVTLRPQLHRMATFPVVVLTFIAGDDAERPDESKVVHVPLDLSRAAHRVALDQLQRRCAIELELFDEEYLPVVSVQLATPLEEHVRYLVAEAKQAMEKVPVATRSFDRARAAFLSSGYDRLGRTVIELPALDDIGRATPAAVRAALQAVARWSEAAAEAYLLEIRGYPLPLWRRLAATVLRRAVEVGIFVPRTLAERVARRSPPTGKDDGLDLPPWPELTELMIRRFAELSARLRPSDLSPADEAANWELLLREAESHGVIIDDAVRRLAEASFDRIGGRPSRRARPRPMTEHRAAMPRRREPAAPRADFSGLGTGELMALLDDRERRMQAALTIAARKEVATLPALFGVMRRMSRTEANALLPRLAAFGAPAERWLIDGLRSKKAFMRQGCALALGRVATPLAVDALVRLLFEEPTEIWSEVARAVGDVGAPAVMPLAARMREVEGDVRERAVQALAHVAARSADGGHPANRTAVETLASGRDQLIANAARRALVLAPDVRHAHEAVLSERREQTLVRAFTRHFYDALDGDADADFDLDSDQLEALSLDEEGDDYDEALDEGDLEPLVDEPAGEPVAASPSPPGAKRPSLHR